MSDNVCVSIDMATPVVVKIDAYAKENKCVLSGEIISRALELYRKFRAFVMTTVGGEIIDVKVSLDDICINANIDFFDVIEDRKVFFQELISMSDLLTISYADDCSMIIGVGVHCEWKAV